MVSIDCIPLEITIGRPEWPNTNTIITFSLGFWLSLKHTPTAGLITQMNSTGISQTLCQPLWGERGAWRIPALHPEDMQTPLACSIIVWWRELNSGGRGTSRSSEKDERLTGWRGRTAWQGELGPRLKGTSKREASQLGGLAGLLYERRIKHQNPTACFRPRVVRRIKWDDSCCKTTLQTVMCRGWITLHARTISQSWNYL